MKHNRNWEREISRLVSGLTFHEVARRLGVNYQIAWRIIKEYGYRAADGRKYGQHSRRRLLPHLADWTESNATIAKKFGVSRERVRMVRFYLGKPRVESRGRKPSNQTTTNHERKVKSNSRNRRKQPARSHQRR